MNFKKYIYIGAVHKGKLNVCVKMTSCGRSSYSLSQSANEQRVLIWIIKMMLRWVEQTSWRIVAVPLKALRGAMLCDRGLTVTTGNYQNKKKGVV